MNFRHVLMVVAITLFFIFMLLVAMVIQVSG